MVMNQYLEDLYSSNIGALKNVRIKNTPEADEYRHLMESVEKNQKKLLADLNPALQKRFLQYDDASIALQLYLDKCSFINGFRLGAQIIMAVLDENDGPFTEL